MKPSLVLFGGVLAVLLCGCSQSKYPLATVSGVVTLDGKVLPDARVVFMPSAPEGSVMAGPASIAFTDQSGRYYLKTKDGLNGAVIASHKVAITTNRVKIDPDDPMKVTKMSEEFLPSIYHKESQLKFIVPKSGTTEANFLLLSEPPAEL